jgi:ATP-dependent protease ClpP protease subunit
MSKAWFSMRASAGPVGEVSIFSDIGGGGVTSKAFHAELSHMKTRGVKTLIISVNSDGGDVSTGFHIFNMLAGFPARKIVRIEGVAASMASVIAMVGDEIIMPSNSMMMIHNPWGGITGNADQLKSFGEALEMMQANIRNAYSKRTGIDPAEIQKMMDRESWLSAQEAVRLGFATRIEGELKAAALAGLPDISKFKNAPPVPRGMEAIRQAAFDKFNRKLVRTAGGSVRYVGKGGRRV